MGFENLSKLVLERALGFEVRSNLALKGVLDSLELDKLGWVCRWVSPGPTFCPFSAFVHVHLCHLGLLLLTLLRILALGASTLGIFLGW